MRGQVLASSTWNAPGARPGQDLTLPVRRSHRRRQAAVPCCPRAWTLGGHPTDWTVPIAPRETECSYAERVDLELVAIFGVILVGGFALGTLLNVVRPADEEAAAMHRHLARRALAWLPDRFQSNQILMQPEPNSRPRRYRWPQGRWVRDRP